MATLNATNSAPSAFDAHMYESMPYGGHCVGAELWILSAAGSALNAAHINFT